MKVKNSDFVKCSQELIDFIKEATCSFTTVTTCKKMLDEAGFNELILDDDWTLKKGGKYYVNMYDSSIFAFRIGKNYKDSGMLRVVTSHSDSPSFVVKPHPEMTAQGNYCKLNIEGYGGAINNSWLDRPLSIALRVAVKSDDCFKPEIKIIDLKKPVVTIPNLAIHMNRDVNKGVELNKQTDMLPIACLNDKEDPDFFMHYISKALKVDVDDILDYEGYIYNSEAGCFIGMEDDFVQCPRLDNATSVYACMRGIIDSKDAEGINCVCVFDNEEIGSMTKQGANSILLTNMLEKIYSVIREDKKTEFRTYFMNKVFGGMIVSLDVAHAAHPNHPEKNDPTNLVTINKGPVIKRSCNQRYATDSYAIGIIEQICKKEDIPFQKFANRADVVGGSTLGPIIDSYLPMKTIDIGMAVLGMHSARETCGSKDQYYTNKLVKAFFEN